MYEMKVLSKYFFFSVHAIRFHSELLFYLNLKFLSYKRWNCTKILYKYFQQALTRNPIFCFHFVNSRHSYPSLVTHNRTRLLILTYNSIFPFLLVALMIFIVMIVIRMPNDGVCPIQVVTQDADMAENSNFNG